MFIGNDLKCPLQIRGSYVYFACNKFVGLGV